MIFGTLSHSDRIEAVHPLLPRLFQFVKTNDLLTMPTGRIEVDGDKIFINNSEPRCLAEADQVLEVHRRYIDVHILLEGRERVGWRCTDDCRETLHPYDEAGDFATFADRPQTYIDMLPGNFLIVFPEDAHAPVIGEGTIRKAIAKVLL